MKLSIGNRIRIDTDSREFHFFEKRQGGVNDDRLFGLAAPAAHSGVQVNETSALRLTAVWACNRLISWTLASLPLVTYRRLPRGKERAGNLSIYELLHDQPNPVQSSFTWRSTGQSHATMWGNQYSEIEFDANGDIVALWPIPPWRCKPMLTEDKRDVFYRVTLPDGTTRDLQSYRVFHISGPSVNGLEGMSLISAGREAIGLGLATEEFGARFFGQGTNIGGVAEHPGQLTEQGHKNLQDSIRTSYEGLGKSHRILLLEEGMKFQKVGIPPEDAQYLQTRKHQVTDVARLFNVPSHLINDLEHATFSNVEQMDIEFVTHTMRPWFVNWEQEIKLKLLRPHYGSDYFSEFLVAGLLRGDTLTRYQSYAIGRQWGWLSPNDIRELENMNPIEGGDRYDSPLNMAPITQLMPPSPDPSKDVNQEAKRELLRSIIERIVEREAQNLARAVKKYDDKPAEFGQWVEDYYRDIRDYISDQFALRQILALPPGYVVQFTARYVEESKAAIRAAAELGKLAQVADGWRANKAGVITEREFEYLK